VKLSQRRITAPSLGGVLATRQGSLLLAVLCATVAAAVLVFALARFKANVAKPIPQASVLVATGEINRGMTGAEIAREKLVKTMPVAADQVSAGAIDDTTQIMSATASTDILPGQQLSTSDFGTVSDVAQAISHGDRAVEISTSEAPGATDITAQGSRVDIYTKLSGDVTYNLVATNVLVLKPATATPVTVGNTQVPGSTLVVEVPDAKVQTVINASSGVYLALRPTTQGARIPLPDNDVASPSTTPAAATTTATTTTTGGQ
jgi:Flp pilus assembly protein CpaB